ncbi:MAG: flagellar motor switch protein FliG [Fidelibacterota bacterium]|nr:MAG: flagellar motor switch protein FliG [Candidatus Neomarinimicrobiota bacterium]
MTAETVDQDRLEDVEEPSTRSRGPSARQEDKELTPNEKAATLLIALGVATSAGVMKHLPDEEVERLSIELAKLRDVSSDNVQKVIADFHEMMMARQYVSQGGLDYAKQVLEKAWGMRKAEEILKRIEAATEVSAFYLLQTVDDAQLLSFLQDEHPQTAALILANLKPKQAANVLSQLSEELQTEIAYRLATMEKTSPEMVREIENVLREQLGDVFGADMRSTGGAYAVAEILNSASRAAEKNILEHLRERDPELAMEVTNLMFLFEDLVTLSDESIQKIVKEVDSKTLAMALKATSDELQEKVFDNMSERAGGMLRDELEFLGAVRVSEVEEAQSQILDVVRRLDEAGEITIARGGEAEELIE